MKSTNLWLWLNVAWLIFSIILIIYIIFDLHKNFIFHEMCTKMADENKSARQVIFEEEPGVYKMYFTDWAKWEKK